MLRLRRDPVDPTAIVSIALGDRQEAPVRDTQAIMEENLRWIRQHFAARLADGGGVEGGDGALRDGLMLLVDMRFSEPPRVIHSRIEAAPLAEVVRWAAMIFQVGGLVAVCKEILQEG